MFKTLFIALSMLSVANPTSAETETPDAINVESATFCNNNMNAFSNWVSDRLVYPEESKKYGSEGVVNVMFSVDENGRVINVKVTKPYDKLLDAEAVRVVSMSPRWKPMRINGKGVISNYTLDVNFKLTK